MENSGTMGIFTYLSLAYIYFLTLFHLGGTNYTHHIDLFPLDLKLFRRAFRMNLIRLQADAKHKAGLWCYFSMHRV